MDVPTAIGRPSWLNGNYQRALFHQVRKSSVTRFRELAEPRRRVALVCFLWQSYRCRRAMRVALSAWPMFSPSSEGFCHGAHLDFNDPRARGLFAGQQNRAGHVFGLQHVRVVDPFLRQSRRLAAEFNASDTCRRMQYQKRT